MCGLPDVNARSACDTSVWGGYLLKEALIQARSRIEGDPVANKQAEAEDPWSSLAAGQSGMQAARQRLQLARRSRDSAYAHYSSTVSVTRERDALWVVVHALQYLRRLFVRSTMFVTIQFAPALIPYLQHEDARSV
jgi:hypothetical protein